MNRRNFIRSCTALPLLASPSFAFDVLPAKRTYNVLLDFDLSHIKNNATLWVPLPSSNDFQLVSEITIHENDKKSLITSQNSYFASTLFRKWGKEEQNKKLSISFAVSTTDVKADLKPKKISPAARAQAKKFLAATKHVQTDGIVKEISDKVSAKHKNELDKARAIYDWVVENMYRDPNVKGCGAGNAKEALEQKKYGGKCLDISAVFVALLRAQNIPARELMGIRLGKSDISPAFGSSNDITQAQHCRSEFFVDDLGWIRADAGDITKLRLLEKLEPKSARESEIANMYFGGFEMNWMALNHARDFELFPLPVQYPLDQFNYPYGESNDDVLDFYDPKTFTYSFNSTRLK